MRDYRLYIFDLDGTLYRGNMPLPYAAEAVEAVKSRGATVRFLTNNSGSRPEDQVMKLRQMGISANQEEVLTSGMGAARYAVEQGFKNIFLVGERGLAEILEDAGLRLVAAGESADAVIAGICRSFTYVWLNDALQAILSGAKFIATNTDATYPVEGGVTPGAGSIVASIETASGIEPAVIGKPNPMLVQMILNETGTAPSDTLVIGDRWETDIESGRRAGCDTMLVLTGVTDEAPEGEPSEPDLRFLLQP